MVEKPKNSSENVPYAVFRKERKHWEREMQITTSMFPHRSKLCSLWYAGPVWMYSRIICNRSENYCSFWPTCTVHAERCVRGMGAYLSRHSRAGVTSKTKQKSISTIGEKYSIQCRDNKNNFYSACTLSKESSLPLEYALRIMTFSVVDTNDSCWQVSGAQACSGLTWNCDARHLQSWMWTVRSDLYQIRIVFQLDNVATSENIAIYFLGLCFPSDEDYALIVQWFSLKVFQITRCQLTYVDT